MSDQETLIRTAEQLSAEDRQQEAVKEAVLAAQMAIIDAAVRQARTQQWCGEFERIMGQLFPEGPPDGSKEYVDSEGWSCRGYDRDGFNRRGYDAEGYGRDGYADNGRDRQGFDREGWDAYGYGRDGFHRDSGRDRAGFDRDGVHANGYRRDSDEYRNRFRFDRNGYDRDGYDRQGRHYFGLTREQREQHAETLYMYEWDEAYGLVSAEGRDRDGYGRDGTRHGEMPDAQILRSAWH